MTKITALPDDVYQPDAARVYQDHTCPERWVVGPPGGQREPEQSFTGPNACQSALEFAHRRYGSARSFSS